MPNAFSDTAALIALLDRLERDGYDFVTPTPVTHRRVAGRRHEAEPGSARDILGWSLPFRADAVDPALYALLEQAGAVAGSGALQRSLVRASRVSGRLYLHSAYPTTGDDAVFLGPDSYRFARFLEERVTDLPAGAGLLDVGAGAGVGGLLLAGRFAGVRTTLVDVNPLALALAAANAAHAGIAATLIEGSGLGCVPGRFDCIIANPPFIIDPERRSYRDGGDMLGGRMSLDWALEGARRLNPGGRLLLYTGSAIVGGRDALKAALAEALPALGCTLDHAELDPDIFGEELDNPDYEQVERIAAIGVVVTRPALAVGRAPA